MSAQRSFLLLLSEAKHLLGVGGMSAAGIEEVQAHLGARALSTLEALVVPL